MIASIKSEGFRYTPKDDLIDKQFTLTEKSIIEKYTSLSQIRFSEIQTYKLFVKNVEFDLLGLASNLKAIRSITRGAKSLMIEEITVDVIKQENGLEAILKIELSEV